MGQSNEVYQHEVRVTWNWTAEKKAKVIGSLGFLSPHILFFPPPFFKNVSSPPPLARRKEYRDYCNTIIIYEKRPVSLTETVIIIRTVYIFFEHVYLFDNAHQNY